MPLTLTLCGPVAQGNTARRSRSASVQKCSLVHPRTFPSSLHPGSVPLHHRFPKCRPLGEGYAFGTIFEIWKRRFSWFGRVRKASRTMEASASLGLRGHGNVKSSLGGMAITLQSGWNSRARDFSTQPASGCSVIVRGSSSSLAMSGRNQTLAATTIVRTPGPLPQPRKSPTPARLLSRSRVNSATVS